MNNPNHIVLLEAGAEGGSLRLVLERMESGIFSYRVIENTCENLIFSDEDLAYGKSNGFAVQHHGSQDSLVIDWCGALKLLDEHRWPWPMLYPSFIHPCVRFPLLTALKDRYSKYPDLRFAEWEQEAAAL